MKQFRTCPTYASSFFPFLPTPLKREYNAVSAERSMKFGNIVRVETLRYLTKITTLQRKAGRKQRRSLRLLHSDHVQLFQGCNPSQNPSSILATFLNRNAKKEICGLLVTHRWRRGGQELLAAASVVSAQDARLQSMTGRNSGGSFLEGCAMPACEPWMAPKQSEDRKAEIQRLAPKDAQCR